MTAQRGRPRDEAARARILAAATELFVQRGYLATTLGDIAEAAGTAVQTIYTAHGSKVDLLAATHDVALAGDDAPVPLSERAWFLALAASPSAQDAWRDALDWMHRSTARVAPVYAAVLAAEGDPAVSRLLAVLRAQRLRFCELLVAQLLSRPGAEGADAARLADLLYATECVETHQLLVVQRGWSLEDWRAWVHDVVGRELVGDK